MLTVYSNDVDGKCMLGSGGIYELNLAIHPLQKPSEYNQGCASFMRAWRCFELTSLGELWTLGLFLSLSNLIMLIRLGKRARS